MGDISLICSSMCLYILFTYSEEFEEIFVQFYNIYTVSAFSQKSERGKNVGNKEERYKCSKERPDPICITSPYLPIIIHLSNKFQRMDVHSFWGMQFQIIYIYIYIYNTNEWILKYTIISRLKITKIYYLKIQKIDRKWNKLNMRY